MSGHALSILDGWLDTLVARHVTENEASLRKSPMSRSRMPTPPPLGHLLVYARPQGGEGELVLAELGSGRANSDGLSALSRVLSSLSGKRTPVRESSLTKALAPALLSGARVAFCLSISPSARSIPQTLLLLQYAQRVRNAKLRAPTHGDSGPAVGTRSVVALQRALRAEKARHARQVREVIAKQEREDQEREREEEAERYPSDSPVSGRAGERGRGGETAQDGLLSAMRILEHKRERESGKAERESVTPTKRNRSATGKERDGSTPQGQRNRNRRERERERDGKDRDRDGRDSCEETAASISLSDPNNVQPAQIASLYASLLQIYRATSALVHALETARGQDRVDDVCDAATEEIDDYYADIAASEVYNECYDLIDDILEDREDLGTPPLLDIGQVVRRILGGPLFPKAMVTVHSTPGATEQREREKEKEKERDRETERVVSPPKSVSFGLSFPPIEVFETEAALCSTVTRISQAIRDHIRWIAHSLYRVKKTSQRLHSEAEAFAGFRDQHIKDSEQWLTLYAKLVSSNDALEDDVYRDRERLRHVRAAKALSAPIPEAHPPLPFHQS
ncbi:hypothetical protein KIPB_001708 [Kipferlia bialata]|uniref:Kinesin motor domain-containing protein n=1 Tax=Kipferlia bialata TaxID=797122 RepID=A0A9K3CQZ9_9EUKA|nr:hypothetical protein KIPB_001708 [Kipferlia bialata]|eukprot:g1708.t1